MTGEKSETSSPQRWQGAWPHVRVILILYHVVAVALFALPPPRKMDDRKTWKTERSQRDLKAWARNLSAIGPDISSEQLEEILFSISKKYVLWRKGTADWFTTYVRYTGTRQGWRMFTSPQLRPATLVVEIADQPGQWTTLYRKNSDSHTWIEDAFDHNRLRKLHGRLTRDTHKHAFNEVALWAARKAAIEFPDAVTIRVELWRTKTATPLELYAGYSNEPEIARQKEYSLERFR